MSATNLFVFDWISICFGGTYFNQSEPKIDIFISDFHNQSELMPLNFDDDDPNYSVFFFLNQ